MATLSKIIVNTDYGKVRHFCDDPVSPDPVWKLPIDCGGGLEGSSE